MLTGSTLKVNLKALLKTFSMRRNINSLILRIIPIVFVSFLASGCEKDDGITVTDIDGNVYAGITIGSQVWMATELKTTKFRDGSAIPAVTDNVAWGNLTTPGMCDYGNTAANAATYGKLYNWYAVADPRGLCPEGWHVPAQVEWISMLDAIGGIYEAGGKMKEVGTTHWSSPNSYATNESGFTSLGGGYRNYQGVFKDLSYNVGYWSSTPSNSGYAMYIGLWFMNKDVDNYALDKKSGINVRCIQDI